jgi:hypothetical protein
MSVLLGCWVLGICVVLIWCSLRVSQEEGTSWARQESTKGHLEYITRLVLYDKAAATGLDSGAESILLMTGIQAIYVREESPGAWDTCVSRNGVRSSHFQGVRPDCDVPFERFQVGGFSGVMRLWALERRQN